MQLINHRFVAFLLMLIFTPSEEPSLPEESREDPRGSNRRLRRNPSSNNAHIPTNQSNISNPRQPGFFSPSNVYNGYPPFVQPNVMHNLNHASAFAQPVGISNGPLNNSSAANTTNLSNISNPHQAGFFSPSNVYSGYPPFVQPTVMHNLNHASAFAQPVGFSNGPLNTFPAANTTVAPPFPVPPTIDYDAFRLAMYPRGIASTSRASIQGFPSAQASSHSASPSANNVSVTSVTVDPDEIRRERARLRQQQHRKTETSTAKRARQIQDAAVHRASRANETEEETISRQNQDAISHQISRANETEDETRSRQNQDSIAHRATRENETADETRSRQTQDAATHRLAYSNQTQTRARELQESNTENQRRRRQEMTGSQHAQVLSRRRNEYQRRAEQRRNRTIYAAFSDEIPEEHYLGLMSIECSSCKALYFPGECSASPSGTFDRCCNHGRVSVTLYDDYPEPLKSLLTRDHRDSSNFHNNIRQFNSSLAMASMDAQLKSPPGQGPYVFRVHGSISHNIGPAMPANANNTSYGQLYFLDAAQAADERIGRRSNSKCSASLLRTLGNLLSSINTLARSFKMLGDVYREEERRAIANNSELPRIIMVFFNDKLKDPRRYNSPTANEVAAVFVGDEGGVPTPREYTVFLKGGGFSKLSVTNPKLDPMVYPIIWPNGIDSWHPNLTKINAEGLQRKRVTQSDYYSFLFSFRRAFNPIHYSGKLFQQLTVDVWLRIEYNNLEYIRHNQGRLRAECYQQLNDFVADGSRGLAGSRVVLPSSHVGSPRHYAQSYQDVMNIVSKYGKPDYFITFTTNPKWKEITENLMTGQTPTDRPDIVTRVFNAKWRALLNDIVQNRILGKVIAHVHTIEFQKRGLPHAHLLVTVASEDKPDSPIDELISAEIPDPLVHPDLYQLVKTHMLHRKCGSNDLLAPCLKNGVCSKGFPKPFSNVTNLDGHNYPEYKRRDTGVTITIGNGANVETYTNQHVVPYSKYILSKYNCHCNIEKCCLVHAAKYLFKYVYKGCDKAVIELRKQMRIANGGVVDEIEEHLDARYMCPPEAMHRILKFEMQERSHSVDRLQVHIPDGQRVTFVPGNEQRALNQVQHQKTTLIAFFDLNRLWCEKEERGEDLGPIDPRTLLYTDLPYHFVFKKDPGNYHWSPRSQGGAKKIGRLMGVPVVEKERFALRQLLLKIKGPTSFEDLKEFNGHVFSSFEGAAKARGLLHDADAFMATMCEAVLSEMPYRLRQLFASLFIFFLPHSDKAQQLWDTFADDLCEDYARGGRRTVVESQALAWFDVSDALSVQSIEFDKFVTPPLPQRPPALTIDASVDHASIATEMREKMNEEQSHAVNSILNGVKLAFVDGPGGCGKTYIYECLYHILKSEGKSVICCAWTGIAGSLLPEGRTISSLFRLNKNDDNRSCNIKPNSKDGRFLRELDAIIMDEVSMIASWTFDAIDIALQDVMDCTEPFGGKTILLGGDFRQVLPIPPKNSGIEPYSICLKRSDKFSLFTTFKLTRNMRASEASDDWKNLLMSIGNGTAEEDESGLISLPEEIISAGDLIEDVYGGCFDDPDHLQSRAILCPLNRRVDVINNDILDAMTGDERTYFSIDEIDQDAEEDQLDIDPEFLYAQNPRGFPLHLLRLKIGSVIMLLRNLNIRNGLCNGTRLQVKKFARNYIQAAFICGPRKSETVLIPRIELVSDDKSLSFKLRRRQFPIRLAFAMTINKSQGQSLDRVGIDLDTDVFGHGQLYVALSRSKTMEGVKVYSNYGPKAKNIVDKEVITENGATQ